MGSPRYKVGQNVRLLQSALMRGISVPCQVLQLMPFDGICFDYRVHVHGEKFDRAAKEHELAETTLRQDDNTGESTTWLKGEPSPWQALRLTKG